MQPGPGFFVGTEGSVVPPLTQRVKPPVDAPAAKFVETDRALIRKRAEQANSASATALNGRRVDQHRHRNNVEEMFSRHRSRL